MICHMCRGFGTVTDDESESACRQCDGKGTVDDEPEEYDRDEYWDDGEHGDTCPWCGSIVCGFMNNDGQLECCITKRIIP